LEELEKLRTSLYKAIEGNDKDEILKLSRELDEVIVKEMKEPYIDKGTPEKKYYI
jgi:hypothetical protein